MEQPTNAGSQAAASEATPLFRLSGVTKRFGGVVAVHDVDFELRPGEVHALVGENGAGKSTLMKIVDGLYEPDEGSLEVNGEPASFSSSERRRGGRDRHDPPGARSLPRAFDSREPFRWPQETPNPLGWSRLEHDAPGGEEAAGCSWGRARRDGARQGPLGGERPDRCHRQGPCGRCQGCCHGRAHLVPDRPRGPPALPHHRRSHLGRRRRGVHLAPARGDLRDIRPHHRAARWAPHRDRARLRARRRGAGAPHGRAAPQRAVQPAPPRPRRGGARSAWSGAGRRVRRR